MAAGVRAFGTLLGGSYARQADERGQASVFNSKTAVPKSRHSDGDHFTGALPIVGVALVGYSRCGFHGSRCDSSAAEKGDELSP